MAEYYQPDWWKAAQGAFGKILTTVGTAVNAPQIVPGGLGHVLQSIGGQGLVAKAGANYTPPPTVKTDGAGGGGGGSWGDEGVLGAQTTTGGGSYVPPTQQNVPSGDQNLSDNARSGFDAELEAIKSSLAAIADVARKSIDRARGVRDEVVGNIGTTYKNLLDQARQKKQSSLETLQGERINTANTYGRAQGTARRAMESALMKNRMLARATNRMDSSFYDDRQAEATGSTARSIADLEGEEAAKLTGIGTRESDTKNWYDTTSVTLGQEEGQLKSKAELEFQDQVSQANYMEQNYGIDATLKKQQAVSNYQSRLDGINQYIQNKALALGEVATKATAQTGNINSYAAINPTLQKALSRNQATTDAATTANKITSMGGVATPRLAVDPNAFIKGESTYEDTLRKLGLLLA